MVEVTEVERKGSVAGGVAVRAIHDRPGQAPIVFDPTHPLADENGNVQTAHVDLGVEMTNLLIANRSYQANIAVMQQAQESYQAALRIGSR